MAKEKEETTYEGRIGDWVLENNHQFIAFNKPAGLAVQPDKTDDLALSQIGAAYTRTALQAIHRLDRPVSGLVLFAKKAAAQAAISKQFQAGSVEKVYLAVVAERPPKDEDDLVDFLLETGGKTNKTSVVASDIPGARRAELYYRYLGSTDRYHLLYIRPKTGRKHQIRVQLAHIGCPLRGDTKYGFKRAQAGGLIDLHAWKLSFEHPVSQEKVHLTAPLPADQAVWAAMQALLEQLNMA